MLLDSQQRLIRLRLGEILVRTGKLGDLRRFLVETREGRAQALGTKYLVQPLSGSTRATLVDAAIGYQIDRNWIVDLNAKNLFDKEYVSGCNDAGRCYWGEDRTLLGSDSYNWSAMKKGCG